MDELSLTGRQVDISLPSILSFSIHPINLSLVPVSLNNILSSGHTVLTIFTFPCNNKLILVRKVKIWPLERQNLS